MSENIYESPLASRYAGGEMLRLFSADMKFSTWRRLWVALARAEKELGLDISGEQIAQMEAHIFDIDYEYAAEMEEKLRHDVMAHVHAFGKACPLAMPIIHLGATSCYVGDNTDIIVMRRGLEIIHGKLLRLVAELAEFAREYKDLPALGFTHFQPAQLTTVGKRAALWIYDLLLDAAEMARRVDSFKLLGSKGATGTQASFMELFDGDHEKIRRMEDMIAAEMGFDGVAPVSGQTYSRKIDYLVLSALSGMAQSAGKFATDMRLLAHLKECEEPFESGQIGSSAMPYKRNPMRCERVCSLARLVIVNAQNGALTAYNQWFERTLDDSANRRVVIPETFLAADAILNICINVASGVRVYPEVIRRHIDEELPFMATENIMMKAVRRGGDRQRLHEAIRSHSALAGQRVKERGLPNDLIERLAADPLFGMTRDEITAELDPVKYTGRAGRQVDEFLDGEVSAALEDARARYGDDFGLSAAYGGDEPRV